MATLRGLATIGGASASAVPATAGVPASDVVVLTDGEGSFLTDGASLSATPPGCTGAAATAAVNTAVVQTIGAVAAKSHRLTSLILSYDAGPTGGNVIVQDGATTILDVSIVAAGPTVLRLPVGGLKGTINTAMTITLAAAGAAVIGKISSGRFTA